MSQQELLKDVVSVLRGIGIPYMVTGSIASSLQGEPRSTHDIDIVIEILKSEVPKLIAAFPSPRYCIDGSEAEQAIDERLMFNLIDSREGDKVDFWILTEERFDRTRFSRKRAEMVLGTQIFVSSPEDTILAKLRWAKLSGGSEKQFGDALRVYEVQYQKLDRGYMESWVNDLGVSDLWQRLAREAQIL